MSDIKPQIQEIKRIQSRINAPKTTYRNIRFEHQKIKQRKYLERSQKEKHLTYRRAKIRFTDLSSETIQARRE